MKKLLSCALSVLVLASIFHMFSTKTNPHFDLSAYDPGPGPHGIIMAYDAGPGPLEVIKYAYDPGPGPRGIVQA